MSSDVAVVYAKRAISALEKLAKASVKVQRMEAFNDARKPMDRLARMVGGRLTSPGNTILKSLHRLSTEPDALHTSEMNHHAEMMIQYIQSQFLGDVEESPAYDPTNVPATPDAAFESPVPEPEPEPVPAVDDRQPEPEHSDLPISEGDLIYYTTQGEKHGPAKVEKILGGGEYKFVIIEGMLNALPISQCSRE